MSTDIVQNAEHRDQRPYRLGKDDADGKDPLLLQEDPQDPRGQGQGRRRGDHGLHGPRAGTGHHHRLRHDQRHLGGPLHQHHRHARPRRLHHRGRDGRSASSTGPSSSSARSAGVQSQTITVDRQLKRYKVPRIAFINKLDRTGANPYKVKDQLVEKLGHNAVLMQVPIGLESDHKGVVDLVDDESRIISTAPTARTSASRRSPRSSARSPPKGGRNCSTPPPCTRTS